ncbi:hypothetical protein ACHAWX_001318 [Stephanocyclus meneghinianus]
MVFRRKPIYHQITLGNNRR